MKDDDIDQEVERIRGSIGVEAGSRLLSASEIIQEGDTWAFKEHKFAGWHEAPALGVYLQTGMTVEEAQKKYTQFAQSNNVGARSTIIVKRPLKDRVKLHHE